MKIKCYNCTKEFEKNEMTKEHIPPRCFSDAYPESFKKDRITVHCCDGCNKLYAKSDSELRDMIAILKDGNDGNQKFLEKASKSILRSKKVGKDVMIDFEKDEAFVNIKYGAVEELFLKCHKGIFYDKFGFPVDVNFETMVNQKMVNEKHNDEFTFALENTHKSLLNSFVISGNDKIFKSSILAFKRTPSGIAVTDRIEEAFLVSSYSVFHNTVDSLVFSIRKGDKIITLGNQL